MFDHELLTKWQASLQRRDDSLRICWRMHDAYHCLTVEGAKELRDVLSHLLSDAEFAEGYKIGVLGQ